MSNRLKIGTLMAVGLVGLLALVAHAADGEFAGRWKGEARATPPAARATPGAAAGSGATADSTAPSSAPATSGRTGGGGRTAGGGFGGGGGAGASQKVSLNLKQSKDNKLSGNIVFGDANADDVKEGRVEGNRITFSAGRAPQPIYAYNGEMKGNELILTRIAPAGDRGPRTTEYVLTKK